MKLKSRNGQHFQRSTLNAQRSTLNSDSWTLGVGRWALDVFFLMPRKQQRPFVSATFAMTVDGKITTRDFTPVNFTSREDKLHLFRQRALADAVMIGHSTLKRDNVRLGLPEDLRQARIKRGLTPGPLRVIVSNEGRIDNQLKIFQSDPATAGLILIFSTKRMPKEVRAALREKNATLHLSETKDVDLAEMLRTF